MDKEDKDKKFHDEAEQKNLSLDKGENGLDEDEKEKKSLQMNKTFSPARSVLRIILGFFALLIWIFIGVYPTLIFTSGIQGFIGTFSFFVRNPIIFLLIAFINILLGAIEHILYGFYGGLHFIFSGQ
jgi:hypothetical protein